MVKSEKRRVNGSKREMDRRDFIKFTMNELSRRHERRVEGGSLCVKNRETPR
jgi:hypothetical protein